MEIWSSKNDGLRIFVRLQVVGPSGFMTQVSIKLLVIIIKLEEVIL